MLAVKHVGVRKTAVEEMPDPVAGAGEVVVAVKAGGICGSDIRLYRRGAYFKTDIRGHEPCGIVIETGDGVDKSLRGKRVSVYHYVSCGTCHWCSLGERHWCDEKEILGYTVQGSCAQKMAVKADCALPIPDSISFESGALIACAAGTTWGALTKLKPEQGQTCAVWGLGPVGLCGIMILKAMGVRVVGIGRRPTRLRLAQELGAEAVIDIDNKQNIVEKVMTIFPKGAHLGYEASGSADAQRNMVQSLARFGKAVCVGLSNREQSINTREIVNKQLTVYGSHVLNYLEYDSFIDFIEKHNLQLDRIVTHRYPFADGDKAFAMADSGDCGKVMIVDS